MKYAILWRLAKQKVTEVVDVQQKKEEKKSGLENFEGVVISCHRAVRVGCIRVLVLPQRDDGAGTGEAPVKPTVEPPSTLISAPTRYDARSDARNTIISAISLGAASRWIGETFPMSSAC